MATISRSVSWTLLCRVDEALSRVKDAVSRTDFVMVNMSEQSIDIDVPRAIVKNRWAAKINGKITAVEEGSEILWTVEALGDKHYEHLVTIADQLPEGTLFDHGIPDAVEKLSNKMFGRKEIRHLANLLDRGELVLAMGVGLFSKKMGAVAITNKRLIFLEKSMLGSESLTEFSLNSIGAMSIGKKMGGEILSITHSGTTAVISGMGHGQADTIARAFRQLKDQPAPEPKASLQDPMAQLERLGELHAKGILTDEEFQTQKAQILSRM